MTTVALVLKRTGARMLHQSNMATRELIWQYKNQLSQFLRSRAGLPRVRYRARLG